MEEINLEDEKSQEEKKDEEVQQEPESQETQKVEEPKKEEETSAEESDTESTEEATEKATEEDSSKESDAETEKETPEEKTDNSDSTDLTKLSKEKLTDMLYSIVEQLRHLDEGEDEEKKDEEPEGEAKAENNSLEKDFKKVLEENNKMTDRINALEKLASKGVKKTKEVLSGKEETAEEYKTLPDGSIYSENW